MNATVFTNASLVVRPLVLERAMWPRSRSEEGVGFRPIKGTWYAYTEKRGYNSSIVVPLVSCPSCAGLLFLSPSQEVARTLGRLFGRIVPVAHRIDEVGKVSPDIKCMHAKCSFHRTLYLDKWNNLRPLYVTAFTEGAGIDVKFAYSHAASRKEALFHLGAGNHKVIEVGRAVGYMYDEATGKVTAD